MKTGRMFTAIQLMLEVQKARAGEEPESDIKGNYLKPQFTLGQLEDMVRAGLWRHRGKGRGGVVRNFLGKRRPPKFLPHQGKREMARRARRMSPVWPDREHSHPVIVEMAA